MQIENAVIVINKTRLEALIERFNTKAQARFYIEHAGGDFNEYQAEHDAFHGSLDKITNSVQKKLKMKVVDRKFVPNFLFSEKDLIVVVGQDGLVANTAKYVKSLPILAINPDPIRNDGILLPYTTTTFEIGLAAALNQKSKFNRVTLAEAKTNDGQQLLAFNDFFIGPSSHVSARYKITYDERSEQQSSSGIIVSTGAGSTGWLSSVMNMANGVHCNFSCDHSDSNISLKLPWDTDELAFVVREPFQSKHSSVSLSGGLIARDERLYIESFMPSNGLIFSDGVEADFIKFNSGSKVEIGIAEQQAHLVVDK